MYDVIKIAKYLEESGLSIKGVSLAIKNEVKGKRKKRRISQHVIRFVKCQIVGAKYVNR